MIKITPAISLIFIFLILLLNAIWFIFGLSPIETESVIRIVLGALVIFLLPGLIWGEIFHFYSDHFLYTIAISFALTLCIEIMPLPLMLIFGLTISYWIIYLLIICWAGLAVLISRYYLNKKTDFIDSLCFPFDKTIPFNVTTPLNIIILVLMTVGTFRWGSDLSLVGGESVVHSTYIRKYYTLPMILDNLGLEKGFPPPNFIFLWEFLIAGWAKMINIDPLPLIFRARFITPVLGISGMYLLIRNIFPNKIKAEAVLFGVLCLSLGGLFFHNSSFLPDPSESYRWVMCFMGEVHHSDTAMDILIALNAGLILLCFREITFKNIFLFVGILYATYLWHPREFFQTGIYLGIIGLTILFYKERKKFLKRWIVFVLLFVFVGLTMLAGMKVFVKSDSKNYDEIKIKKAALTYALSTENIIGIRNLFNFPRHLTLAYTAEPEKILSQENILKTFKTNYHFDLWLILSGLAISLLTFWGDIEDKYFSLFLALLWFLILSWNFSMLILIALTYNEILITTCRFIYIFSYIIIPSTIYLLCSHVSSGENIRIKQLILLVIAFAIGLLLRNWSNLEVGITKLISIILSIGVWVSILSNPILSKKKEISTLKPVFFTSCLAMILIFIPMLAEGYNKIIPGLLGFHRENFDWSESGNPFSYSKKLIHYLKSLPHGNTFAIDPVGTASVSVYSPQYQLTLFGAILKTAFENKLIASQRHILFNFETYEGINLYSQNIFPKPIFDSKNIKRMGETLEPFMLINPPAGNFSFIRKSGFEGEVFRISLLKKEIDKQQQIDIGLASDYHNFEIFPKSGDMLWYSINLCKSKNTKTNLFISEKDAAGNWNFIDKVIDKDQSSNYFIAKLINDDNSKFVLGIHWEPLNEEDWLEFKHVKIYILPNEKINMIIPSQEAHENIKKWLQEYSVNFIPARGKYYNKLLRYFKAYPRDYQIDFDNQDNQEAVVKFLDKAYKSKMEN